MRLRIFTEPQQGASYQQLLAVAREAERLGFDAFFRSDHYLHMGDNTDGRPGPTDAWVTLGGLARETSTIRLGTLVTAATFRLPGPLAISVAQVDEMSGGRVELGIGTGWYDAEHRAYGIPFPDLGTRFGRLEEQLEIMTGMWRTPIGDTYSFDGEHYQVGESPALPKPVQDSIPIIIGGYGPRRTPRLAAKYAREFNLPFPPVDVFTAMVQRVHEACRAEGRDPASLRASAAVVVCCGESEGDVERRAAAIGREPAELRENGAAGSPDEVLAKLLAYREAGADAVYLQLLDLDDLDHLGVVAERVLPHVG